MSSSRIVKLLIVDDKPENLQLIKGFFDGSDFSVFSTTSPEEAVEMCNEIEMDLLLVDIRMAVSGFDVYHSIRSTAKNSSTPVIYMAEKTDQENISKAFRMGCRDIITKPFQSDELISKISTHSLLHRYCRQIEELISSKEKIYSIISHDLRSPYNSIIAFSNLLIKNLSKTDNKEAVKYAEIINELSVRNLELIDSLLVYTKSFKQDMQDSFERININNLVSELLQVIQPSALLKEIQLSQIFCSPVDVLGNRDLIATMIRNIVANAIKFTDREGEVTIQIIAAEKWVEIAIADTGIGIDEAELNTLFSFDTKVSRKGTAGEVGNGYGLMLSKEIADKHHGEISAKSKPGVGTTFSVKLPVYNL